VNIHPAHEQETTTKPELRAFLLYFLWLGTFGFGGPIVHSSVLDSVAASLQAKPMQVALAWLLQRSPNILLIPGTSSVAHVRENLAAATMDLSSDAIGRLDEIVKGSSASVASRASH